MPVQVHLAAFGKHPGWNDHIDDLGLETQRLIDVKRILYIDGVGGNIDSGTWEKLDETERLDDFKHIFVWHTAKDWVVGRFWSSTDGKGRARYPMVVCAQCQGLPLAWVVSQVLPRLEAIQQQCVEATEAEQVRAIMDDARRELRELANKADLQQPDSSASLESLVTLADHPLMGEAHEGLLRILYQVDRERSAGSDSGAKSQTQRTQLRVPSCTDSPAQSIELWVEFVRGLLGDASTFLVIVPLDFQWVDLLIGEPVRAQFFCIKVQTSKMPLTTEIPYKLEDTFIQQVNQMITEVRQGASTVGSTKQPLERRDPGLGVGRSSSTPQTGAVGTISDAASPAGAWRKVVVIALIVAGLSLMVGWLVMPRQAPPTTQPPQPDLIFNADAWSHWCQHYDQWFGRFHGRLNEEARQALQGDAHLRVMLDNLDQANAQQIELDPRVVANTPEATLIDLQSSPTPAAQEPSGIRQTKRALGVIETTANTIRTWPALHEITQRADEFEQRNWTGLAQQLRSLRKETDPDHNTDLLVQINRVLTISQKVDEIEKLWQEVLSITQNLEQTDDRVLKRFGGWVRSVTAWAELPEEGDIETSLTRLDKNLHEIKGLALEIQSLVQSDWRSIDHAAFANESKSYSQLDQQITRDTFLLWQQEIEGFYIPQDQDPRLSRNLADRWAKVRRQVENLQAQYAYQIPEALAQDLAQTEEVIRRLLDTPWIVRNVADIETQWQSSESQLTRIEAAVDQVTQKMAVSKKEYEQDIKARESISASQSPAIDKQWQIARDEILASVDTFQQAQRRMNKLETFLLAIEQAFPVGLPGAVTNPDWNQAVASAVLWPAREKGFSETLAAVRWVDGVPVQGGPHEAIKAQFVQQYNDLRSDAATLLQDFKKIDHLLTRCVKLDEPTNSYKVSIADLYGKWENSNLLKEPLIHEALSRVINRIGLLQKVRQSDDHQNLLGMVLTDQDVGATVRLAAWRRLGKLSWEDAQEGLTHELAMRERLLSQLVYHVKDEDVRASLQAELDEESRLRWQRYFKKITAPDAVDRAIGLMDQFNVKREQLDEPTQFNVFLHAMREVDPSIQELSLIQLIRRFQQDVKQLPTVMQRDEIATLIDDLAKLQVTSQAQETSPSHKPAKIGLSRSPIIDQIEWEEEVSSDGDTVTYTWKKPNGVVLHKLVFIRVDTDSPAVQPFYLCTQEVSVGLFLDVVKKADQWPQFTKLLRDFRTQGFDINPPQGACTWIWKNYGEPTQAAKLSKTWLLGEWAQIMKDKGDEIYRGKPGKPKKNHPMQQVSAQAAMYFASLLGCRLPTSAEWRSAYNQEKDYPSIWNLRDITWMRQQEYVFDLFIDGDTLVDWPDDGIFWPELNANRGKDATTQRVSDNQRDGLLWFGQVQVGAGRVFTHLVGNVSEMVYDDAEGFSLLANPSSEDIQSLLEQGHVNLSVIGGSALSPDELQVDQPYAVDWQDAQKGFSDVGFRLAFSIPNETMYQKFRRLISSQSYLAE